MSKRDRFIMVPRWPAKKFCQQMQVEVAKILKMDFTVATPKGITEYKKGRFYKFTKHRRQDERN